MNNNEALTLPEIQQEALKVLLKLDSLCKEHSWNYCITYGTLLGAIRHNGFIPWDDDVDVFMPRKDFDEFCKWCEENNDLIKPFKLCNCKTVKDYPFGLPRLSNMDFKYVTTEIGYKDFDIGVFIDIYPLDNYCNTKEEGTQLVRKLIKLNLNRRIFISGIARKGGFVKKVIKYIYHLVLRICNPKNYTEIISDKIREMILHNTSNNDIYVGCPAWTEGCYQFKREWFEKLEVHCFEGYQFPIPSGYDDFMKCLYGDYMQLPPEEKRTPYHNYKIYRR